MNYRISIIDFTNLNNFLKFLKKVKKYDVVPVRNTNRDERPSPFVSVGVPTGTSIRPDLLVPVGEPGRMAQPNRDNRGVSY